MANFIAPRAIFTAAYFGRAYIAGEESGVVTIKGEPAARKILCFEQQTLTLCRSTWSDENGNYKLPNLDPNRRYLVMAIDDKGQYDPVCYDNITPYLPTNEP